MFLVAGGVVSRDVIANLILLYISSCWNQRMNMKTTLWPMSTRCSPLLFQLICYIPPALNFPHYPIVPARPEYRNQTNSGTANTLVFISGVPRDLLGFFPLVSGCPLSLLSPMVADVVFKELVISRQILVPSPIGVDRTSATR